MLILYLIANCTSILIISLISELVVVNISNVNDLKKEYKTEFYLTRDILFSISRNIGYFILFFVVSFFGMQFISYVMILCSFSIFLEALVIGKLSRYS